MSCSGPRGRGVKSASHAPHSTRTSACRLREFLYQYGFADACFAGYERNTAASIGSGIEPFCQLRQIPFTLEQFHSDFTPKRDGRL